jgi:hypothetical protein
MLTFFGRLPVTRIGDAAAALGVPRREVFTLIEHGVLIRLTRKAVIGETTLAEAAHDRRLLHLIWLRAMLLNFPDCAASHESAAIARGLPVLSIPSYVILTRTSGAWRSGNRVRVRIAPLEAHEVSEVDGIPCTIPERTYVDIARTLPFRDAVVVGDAVLRTGISRVALTDALCSASQWADLGKARCATDFLDARSESALESVSRAVIHEGELPAPDLQHVVELDPHTTYRLDFFWRPQRVGGEADGLSKYTEPDVLRAEKIRQERVEQEEDIAIVRWTMGQILGQTDATLGRIARALDK